MTKDRTDKGDHLPNWQVAQVRAETVEVTSSQVPKVKYILKATKRALKIEAFENDELVEENLLVRAVHEFILEVSDGADSRLRLAINSTKDTIVTHVLLNNEEFQVESAAGEHALLLHHELRKRQLPNNRRIQLLVQELRRNDTLLDEIKRNTSFGPPVIRAEGLSNGVLAACVTACALCAFGSFPACVACAICIELPDPTTSPPPITLKQ